MQPLQKQQRTLDNSAMNALLILVLFSGEVVAGWRHLVEHLNHSNKELRYTTDRTPG